MKTVVKIQMEQIDENNIHLSTKLKGGEVDILMSLAHLVSSMLGNGISAEVINGAVKYGFNDFEEKRVEE
jgi:transcriptional/translational regulatory protein YebC/TACO1